MRKTKNCLYDGPFYRKPGLLRQLMENGMNVAVSTFPR